MNETKVFKPGEIILRTGTPAEVAYIILSGRAQVYLKKGERVVTLAELEIGSLFGESALFEKDSEYGADVKALEETEVALVTRESFTEKLENCDPMVRSIVTTLIERQRHTNEALLERETQEFMDIDLVDADD